MSEISVKQLEKFKELYKNHFKKELGNDEAYSKAIKLVELVGIAIEVSEKNENYYEQEGFYKVSK